MVDIVLDSGSDDVFPHYRSNELRLTVAAPSASAGPVLPPTMLRISCASQWMRSMLRNCCPRLWSILRPRTRKAIIWPLWNSLLESKIPLRSRGGRSWYEEKSVGASLKIQVRQVRVIRGTRQQPHVQCVTPRPSPPSLTFQWNFFNTFSVIVPRSRILFLDIMSTPLG
ncbi:hypothetical protein BGY98DRAFT_152495 [Russula aff. rugulosa BPL654]|nr:hypothetical protein BGY98DRAFT_152495 [Russula aff. rugulosa BPL654]